MAGTQCRPTRILSIRLNAVGRVIQSFVCILIVYLSEAYETSLRRVFVGAESS